MNVVIRNATDKDKAFVINSIIEAEKSGGANASYCNLFDIFDADLRILLDQILDESMEGQEICLEHFLIAEVNGTPAGAVSAWVEKANDMASNMIKSNLFMFFVNREKLLGAATKMKLLSEIGIERDDKALQIECVYTAEPFRGKGITKMLIDEHINRANLNGSDFNKVQVILLGNNVNARKAYEKAGFVTIKEKNCADNAILSILPYNSKILMEKQINK